MTVSSTCKLKRVGDLLQALDRHAGVAVRLPALDLLLRHAQQLGELALGQPRGDPRLDQRDRQLSPRIQRPLSDAPGTQVVVAGELGAQLVALARHRVEHRLVDLRMDVRAWPGRRLRGERFLEALQLRVRDSVLALVGDHANAPRSIADDPLCGAGEQVALEVVDEPGAGRLGRDARREQLSAVLRLLRSTLIAEVQQHRVKQTGVDAGRLPARVEVPRHILARDEAAVQIHARAARGAE